MSGGSLQSRRIPSQPIHLSQILRPIAPVLDLPKIESMVQTLQNEEPSHLPVPAPENIILGQLPPVDVLHYQSPTGKDFYFAFGGCHRLQAYERAHVENVNCRVMKVTKQMLKVYLGGSVDAIVGIS
ncbi:ParB/Sulfiredoxin [Geopyxis carbonaria]|nr:ParB/Sulfiredoxin [Geopyxis carbonaria]